MADFAVLISRRGILCGASFADQGFRVRYCQALRYYLSHLKPGPTVLNEPNLYALDPSGVREPPTTWRGRLPYIGPGFVLSASIVGSGELIATTTLGAKTGFIALWVILLSCLVKVALQLEFGRFTIQHGLTCMESLNRLPGPAPRGVNWIVWMWIALWPVKLLQVGGILGGFALLMNLIMPALSITVWVWVSAGVVAILVSMNRYALVEKSSLVLLGMFTILTLISVCALQWTPLAIDSADILSGLKFELPAGAMLVVIGAFGITGVGGDEIMHYTYWLIEKGYAAYTGPREDTEEWRRRAEGWIQVMYLDALFSMVAYTLVTAAFYLLGAAVLHASGDVPSGYKMIDTLATMYTTTLGPWAKWVYLAGAFVVLFSTLFSALAAWTRVFADAFAHVGGYEFRDNAYRNRAVFVLAWAFPLLWAVLFIYYKEPVGMVILGGVVTSFILLMVVFAAIYFRLRGTVSGLQPSALYDAALWVSCASIGAFAIYGFIKVVTEVATS